ncbi:glycosyltransferase family 4 protein [Paenibacillus medicaginis]|uniref:Glycosyltransferase family 4 protein n=1 Tax=Paenibacillus medicaginis TaxID=1470560 RepID=A0ABV5C2F6_9BACL
MNILLATYWPIPHLGGVWPFMLQIKRGLEKLGHTVDLLGNGMDPPKFQMVNQGRGLGKEFILPVLERELSGATAPLLHMNAWVRGIEMDRYCMELSAAYFGLDHYDIIHTQDAISTIAISRVKGKHTPLVASIHGSIAREVMLGLERDQGSAYRQSPVWKYYWGLEHYGGVSADVTIASTHWMKNILVQQFAVPEQQITVFQYGLNTDKFWSVCASGTDMAAPPGKKVMICPARLVYIKGLHFLISALQQLKRRRSDWVCWIVGEGEKKGELMQQALQAGIGQDVMFLGHRMDIPALLQQADIFVHPSIQDNMPFSVIEAQILGLPAVVSNAGGLPEMVQHEVTGLVSPVGDVNVLASHLEYLLSHDEARVNMGAAAKAWGAAHWSIDQMIGRILQVYEQVSEQAKEKGGVR